MDKTGTLTKGEPEVTDVVVDGIDRGLGCSRWRRRSSGSPSTRWPRLSPGTPTSEGAPALRATGFRNVAGTVLSPTSMGTGSPSATAG